MVLMKMDGSQFMSNRVLKPDQTYHACLVSLEGRLSENILPTNPAIVTKISKAKIDPKHTAAMLMANVGLPSFGKKQTGKVSKEIEKEVRSPINVQSFTNLILLHHWLFNSFRAMAISGTYGTFNVQLNHQLVMVSILEILSRLAM